MKYNFEKIKKIEKVETAVKQIVENVEEFQKFLDLVNVYLNIEELGFNDNDETIFT